jgi:hypothetical protein
MTNLSGDKSAYQELFPVYRVFYDIAMDHSLYYTEAD